MARSSKTATADSDPCSLDTSFSIDIDDVLTADLSVTLSHDAGFSIVADADLLGLRSRFTGTIDDSGFSVSVTERHITNTRLFTEIVPRVYVFHSPCNCMSSRDRDLADCYRSRSPSASTGPRLLPSTAAITTAA